MNDRSSRNKIIQEVISQYTDRDVLSLVQKKIKNGNYIEAYSITDQYVDEIFSRIIIVKKENIEKIREKINVIQIVRYMDKFELINNYDTDYLSFLKKFKKKRNELVHYSIHAKPIVINRELKSMPVNIILRTDLFYLDFLIDLIRFDKEKLYKNDHKKLLNRNEQRLRYFLDFLLNLYSISLKQTRNKQKSVRDFSDYLTRVFGELLPSISEERMGVKRDYKKFYNYTLKLITRNRKIKNDSKLK